jgi:hypothetical protein
MSTQIPFNKGAVYPSECISEAWEIIKDRYWIFLLFVLIEVLIIVFIPIVRWFLYGPMMVGIYYAALQKQKERPISAETFLKGFSIFLSAMVIGLIESGLQLLNDILSVMFNGVGLILQMLNLDMDKLLKPPRGSAMLATDPNLELLGASVALIIIFVVIILLFSIAVSFAWRITFIFALPLLADHPELNIGEALSLGARAGWSNAGGLIVLMILQTLVGLLGLLALCIGIFFVMPVIEVSNVAAYRMVFPDVQPPPSMYNEPPRPEYYTGFGQGQGA